MSMTIGVIGLGLIGGSIAKALKGNSGHRVLGFDADWDVLENALRLGAIDGFIEDDNFEECEILIVALYPRATIDYIKAKAPRFKKGCIVMDCCGVKQRVCSSLESISKDMGFWFIGGHPMAGIEKSGFYNSDPDLFQGASLILTPYEWTSESAIETVKNLGSTLGFGGVQFATPERHDEMIAYTSQLAHVVSCAYVTSPLATDFYGFSAGSFRDMTRVAILNDVMWSELFIENSEFLCDEIENLAARLIELSSAIREGDREKLRGLLQTATETKMSIEENAK